MTAENANILSKPRDLVRFRNWLARYLTEAGGDITDMGYDVANDIADVVVRAPDGHCIEVTARLRG